jgi:5-methyltetrahydrofolate--homocysteine methyltransferase
MTGFSLFSDADWPRLERDWISWWNGTLERPMIVLETRAQRAGIDWTSFDPFLTQFPEGTPIDVLLDHSQLVLEATHYYGDAYPKWDSNFGAGSVAAFLGAAWHHDTAIPTTWFQGAQSESLADISIRVDSTNPMWRTVQAATGQAIDRWAAHGTICYADLGGNLDILASLRGTQDLLYDMCDVPDEVERLCRQITDAWLAYYDALDALIAPAPHGSSAWAPLWAPRRTYMLQSDFAYMVSPAVFERFVLPDLETCCAAIDHPFYHLDGKGQLKHLDMLLSIDKLRGIQWVPGAGQPPADQWPEVLHRIRAGGKLCQIYVDREGAFRVAREHGGKGFVIWIAELLTDEEAGEFLEAFWREYSHGEAVAARSHSSR